MRSPLGTDDLAPAWPGTADRHFAGSPLSGGARGSWIMSPGMLATSSQSADPSGSAGRKMAPGSAQASSRSPSVYGACLARCGRLRSSIARGSQGREAKDRTSTAC